MKYPSGFIGATEEYNDFGKAVAAPYIRKSFVAECDASARLVIAVCGFYELYVNGQRCTKGFFAPYISNTDDYIYCDVYEVPIVKGENVIGILLGNGFQNNPGGYVWEFDKAPFRSAPMFALTLTYTGENGTQVTIESDTTFKTHESPIRSDDYRFGEYYDANYEIPGWNDRGFCDLDWANAIEKRPPRGEMRICKAEPIIKAEEMKHVKIIKDGNGYIYDFGINNSGLCRLCIDGMQGQKIEMRYGEVLINGTVSVRAVWFMNENWERDKEIVHKDTYVCKGEKGEEYMPSFTYHGFRYVRISGITEEQATPELLTYCVLHSDIKTRGGFHCSDDVVNKLQEMTRRSDISNFYYFPTDCPQREKNGWTADIALSCEQMMLNFAPEVSFREWLRNVCKAQNDEGALPGIVPTCGWGFEWGNGPAWDCVLVYLPYFAYIYRGEKEMIMDAAHSIMAYLDYLSKKKDEDGLMHIGLGDWCHVGNAEIKAPLEVTDTIVSMDIAEKAAVMFEAVGMRVQYDFAKSLAEDFKSAIRKKLIDYDTMTVKGNAQTCQAMGLYYNIFIPEERQRAFDRLLEMIHDADDHFDVGVLGGRVIFHVLTDFGYSELALKMITRPDYPSYGNWIQRGATTLWESFSTEEEVTMNHHFWGDISAWFIKCIAGIRINPKKHNADEAIIHPVFISSMDFAEGYYEAPAGKILSSWKREGKQIILKTEVPKNMAVKVSLDVGFCFENGNAEQTVVSGEYIILNRKDNIVTK